MGPTTTWHAGAAESADAEGPFGLVTVRNVFGSDPVGVGVGAEFVYSSSTLDQSVSGRDIGAFEAALRCCLLRSEPGGGFDERTTFACERDRKPA